MATTLFILNGAPYGTELSYNGLRLAGAIAKRENQQVQVFLLGDAAACAKKDQRVPQGYYNTELMIDAVTRRDGQVAVCGTCMDARGIKDEELTPAARRGTLEQLAEWTTTADRVLVF
ncbi:MAG: hypothetical protein A2W18_11525 [Candidatus Muproteobacteria bacterium RBG_16_60_9]|uniref:Uncharacterized protein n=1 Tax=Candidatus Muproteobacteria bacterium RBG_16_60_9 TaxID=1817755 RepID=A0A1F6V2V9_9PROT|nr:MAG: hypothetical protein A2W18_11525 [Candidatus Muproteobacteria bacterium RBG_16_60_9]